MGLNAEDAPQFGPDAASLKQKFTEIFKSKTRAEWCKIFDNTDACVMPILNMKEAHHHPHSVYQKSFMEAPSGGKVPKPAPNLERTPGCATALPDPGIGQHTMEVLKEYGFQSMEMKNLAESNVVFQSDEKSKL